MSTWHRFRSAITGRFVKRRYAQIHKRVTVSETVYKAEQEPEADDGWLDHLREDDGTGPTA